jgi:hypothetical protein
MSTTQSKNDECIEQLHVKTAKHWPELEKLIYELKCCGQHSVNGNNALDNVRQWLRDLSKR